ncbi:neurobeachin-like protein 1 [Diadema setosum]|uniref:neurobeachin-like protein 1 n=1 Tax=Diadema setosum TaxID=31175 RepID=UPI003B3ADB90
MGSQEQMYELWLHYSTKRDIQLFKTYVERFLQQYQASLDLSFTHIAEGKTLAGPNSASLPDGLLETLVVELASCSRQCRGVVADWDVLRYATQIVQVLIATCRHHDNIALVGSCEYFKHIIPLATAAFKTIPDQEGLHRELLVNFVQHSLHLIECMYDPLHLWRRHLSNHSGNTSTQVFGPALLSVEVVPFFYDCLMEPTWSTAIKVGLHCHILHMFGAIVTGYKSNAQMATTPPTVDMLFRLLTSESDNGVTKGPPTESHTVTTLVLRCLVQMIKVIHSCSPEERQVELSELLEQLLQALRSSHRNSDVQYAIFRSIPQTLLDSRVSKQSLQRSFVKADVFTTLLTILETATVSDGNKQLALFFTVHLLGAILNGSQYSKEVFKETIGYEKLGELIVRLGSPSQELIETLLDMVLDTPYKADSKLLIQNTGVVSLLLFLLPHIHHLPSLQETVIAGLAQSCVSCDYNRMQCCYDGIVSGVIGALQSREQLHRKTEERLIGLLESLGSYSITASQFKTLIGLMRGPDDQSLSPNCTRLMRAVSHMARKEGKLSAHHYFDFQADQTGITIPQIKKWPGSSFSFHSWVCLNTTHVTLEKGFYRRQLYSFYTASGCGFEAFFTLDGVLVVAVCTKKEFFSVSLTDYPITDNNWHQVNIVHSGSKRPFVQSQLSIYVDGYLRQTSQLKFPSMGEAFVSSVISSPPTFSSFDHSAEVDVSSGARPRSSSTTTRRNFPFRMLGGQSQSASEDSSVSMVPANMKYLEWGPSRSLQGQMGSACVFHDTLSPVQVKKLYTAGPNVLTLFQVDDPDLADLNSKVLIYYHGKACKDATCMDLSRNPPYDGTLAGHSCSTGDLKDVLNGIGGVQILFPLLELSLQDTSIAQDITTPEEVDSPTSADGNTDGEWEILPANMQCEAKLERTRISGFLVLLKNICIGHSINQELLHKTQGLATIGALLQKAEPSLIDVNVLMAVQLLVEAVCMGNPHLLKTAHRHILFDFRIWSRSDFPVRIGHIQYLSTIIKDNRKNFRKAYGVQFMLDVIRTYYSCNNTDLAADDAKAIRHSLRGLIRYYVYRNISHVELQSILGFTVAVKEDALVNEALDLLLTLLETPGKDQLLSLLFEHGSADLLYVLLTRKEYPDGVQVRVLKLFAAMLHSTKVSDKNKTRIRLLDIGFSGLTLLMEHSNISMSVAKTLMELVTEGQLNHRGLLAVLQVLHTADALVKLEACTQLLHILYTQPEAKTKISQIAGWQDTLVRLLIKTEYSNNSLSVDMNGFFSTKQLQASESSLDSLPTENNNNQTPPLTPDHPPFTTVSSTLEGFMEGPLTPTPTGNGAVVNYDTGSHASSEQLSQEATSLDREHSDSSASNPPTRPTQIVIDHTPASECSPSIPGMPPSQSESSWSLPISVDTDSIATESMLSIDTPDNSSIVCVVDSGVSLTRPSDLDISSSDREMAPFDVSPGGVMQRERNEQTLVDTLIEILVQIMWVGQEGCTEDAWVARGQVFKCISDLAGSHQILRSVNRIKRQMLEKLLEGAAGDVRSSGPNNLSNSENALYVVKLVYDFLFGVSGLDAQSWSVKLEEGVVDLLDVLQVWTLTAEFDEWKDMSQLGLRLLLRFASHKDLEICAMASARLHHLIQSRPIAEPSEACFFLGSLDEALISSMDDTDGAEDSFAYMIPLARAMIDKYRDTLGMATFLLNLPSTETSPTFVEDFKEYCRSDEWRMYIEKQVKPFMHEFITNNYSDISAKMSRFWRKCFDVMNTDIHKRERERGESKLKFTAQVTEPFNALCKTENARYASMCTKLTNQHQSTMRQWRAAKRFLIGERGAWAERNPEEIYWKLSSQENFSRMRLKLTQNYNYDRHLEASQQRDNTGVAKEESQALPLAVAKEARVSDMELQDDRLGDEEWNLVNVEGGGEDQGETVKEKVVVSEDCQLITLVDVIPGKLEVTTTHVYFYDTSPEKEEVFGQDFKWSLSHLREVHLRRYNLRRSAIEVFFINQTNYFINFSDRKIRNKAYSRILGLRPPNLYYTGAKSPADLLKASGLTQKWVQREISNFDYLMQLNTIAGRTYNDLSQYPVFPWILSDYTSEELDLNNPEVFRDLSKPIGVVNPKNIAEVKSKYENFEDPSGTIDKFHYGTHYSNAAGVMHYLVRMEPFTTLHIQLQSGRFDCADRQFHSIASLWDTLMENPNDVKELIPEFFYLPEFLVNANDFDLGHLQTGERVEDVILPNWAKSPEDFIYKHRQALESDYVSSHLHEWIDLIFGHKQKGPAAVEALNVFYYCTYEGAVDLDAIKNDLERRAVEGMINNFGQTPCQLLKEPHPQRRLASAVEEGSAKGKGLIRSQPNFHNVFEHLTELKAFFVEASTCDFDPLVYVRVPKSQAKSFIYQGMPDTMVTVTQRGVVGTHSWLPYDRHILNYFTFDRDSTLLSPKTRKLVSGPFAPGLSITSRLFVATHDARLLFVGGHWDNSLRVFNLKSSGRLVGHVTRHMGVVTCVALDSCGMQLITGSRDTTCMVWEVTYQNGMASGINNKPVQTLYGHDDEVTCVALSSQLDMAVSASKDGTIIVNTILKGHYVRTLRPPCDPNAPLSIPCLAISEEGQIIVHLRQPAASKHMQDHCSLQLYSINGKHLTTETTVGYLTDMEVVDDFLLTADSRGYLCFRKIFELKVITTMRLQLPIHCLSVVPTKSHVLAGLRDGKLIIVSIDRPPEARKLLG